MGSINMLNHFLALRSLDEQSRVQFIYEYDTRAFSDKCSATNKVSSARMPASKFLRSSE